MFKKKAVVAGVTVLLVCIAVYLNWNYQRDGSDVEPVNASGEIAESTGNLGDTALVDAPLASAATREVLDEYFANARLTRQQARDAALTVLDERLQGTEVAETARTEASEAARVIAQNAIREANIEGLVLAKGYTHCLAYIGDKGLTVIVTAADGKLSSLDTAKITDIAVSETGLSADKIRIVEATPKTGE